MVRLHLVEALIRFVRELGLGAYRFDYVDGLVRQYQNRDENYGELLLRDLVEGLPLTACIRCA